MLQKAGQIVAHHTVDKEAGGNDHDRRANNAPAGQQHERNAKTRHDRIKHGIGAGAELQRGIIQNKVTGNAGKRAGENAVIPRQLVAVGLLRSGVEDIRHGDRQTQVGIAQDLKRDFVGNGRIELEQRPQRQHDLDDLIPFFREYFVL